MLLERTLTQLQLKPSSPERARELGQMGYLQWLGGLAGRSNYVAEAERALQRAQILAPTDPAVAAFCALLKASIEAPLHPLDLSLPRPQRRGGARERRGSL